MLDLSVSNLVITILNLLVLYVLLKKFLYQPVMDVIEKRQEMIDSQLANAKQTEQEAMHLKRQYEQSLEHAKEESARITEGAKLRAQDAYNVIVQEADCKAGKLIENAKKQVEREREDAIREMKQEVAALAMEAAVKILQDGQALDRKV